ncbi:DUF4167 domain-containing protein [Hirschia baltica]|uniref:DUF4167 domain-containing protein n=1 Tax=Hirschia baltica (strain ATCC 49814 / DSM 5838 / IFAM 1418) TaxID=582402 RepID=C6XPZ3_HIRBI|nr:DUF4167 domain-containing protein [Hirschia baltica]ACT58510.1 conserved hypothetical protein [Hirschia baltica ATCC 49814]
MKRQRGRGRKPNNSGNRSLESNGPEVKIRGSASQIYEKYVQYARDAQTAGDRVKAENLFQHAEHYYRIMQANMPKDRPQHQNNRDDAEQSSDAEETTEAVAVSTTTNEAVEDPLQVVDASGDSDNELSNDEAEEAEKAPPKKRVRRPRRKPVEATESKPDEEARSALDTLAEQQAEIAGN